jgi:hypothetical protein
MIQNLTPEQVNRWAGGRRRYNFQRELAARARREKVRSLMASYGRKARGVQARIARELGVSEATISRDVQSLRLVEWAVENPADALKVLYG